MGTTNVLDLNNRVSKLSNGVTSVEEAVDKVKGDLSIINLGNYIDARSTKTFTVKKMYCHMLFSSRTNSVSMIAYGNLVDMVNNSNLTVTVIDAADRNEISITNNNNLSTNIVLI